MTDTNDPESTANENRGSPSRRGFLTKSAVAGGALLALGGGAGVTLADQHTAPDVEASFDDVAGTDVDVLNYALTLEHLEAAFYQTALERFDEAAFLDADALSEFTEAQRQEAYGYVGTLAEHEAQHVAVLTQAVELLGGNPVMAAEYEFGFETVGEFLSLAATLENTGVAAYAGAAPYVESPDLLSTALAIHSVEARHAAAMNAVSGSSPYPDSFDEPSAQSDVLSVASAFIVEEETEATGTDGTADGNETPTETANETVTEAGNETATDTGTGTDGT